MINTLIGIKKGMTSGYDSRGRRVGATILNLGPNFVTHIKNPDSKDGYSAIQLGYGTKKSVKKPQLGHLKKANIEEKVRWMREVRTEKLEDLQPGQQISVGQVFSIGDAVKVTGVSKGKGFQGGVRRHGFHGGPKTHGQSDRHRAPGSIGSGTTPGRVFKGKKMAGHMGVEGVSYKNLEVIALDKVNNLITLKGGIPGATGGLVIVENIGRIKGYTPPPEEKEDEEEELQDEGGEKKAEPNEGSENKTEQTPETKEPAAPVEEKGETENAS